MNGAACDCPECRAMCTRRPCWPTPEDARQLIAAGFGPRLMAEWWFDHAQDKTVFTLTPAIRGREGGESPAHPSGPCTFLNAAGRCELHDLKLKPTEGRLALCGNRTPEGLHEQIGRSWDNDDARVFVAQWEKHHRQFNQPIKNSNPGAWHV
jgi:hypothetical protein